MVDSPLLLTALFAVAAGAADQAVERQHVLSIRRMTLPPDGGSDKE